MKVTNEGIKRVLTGILSFDKKQNAEAFDAVASLEPVKRAIEFARKGRFEEFYFELQYPFENAIDGLLESVTNCDEAAFLLKHSEFVERHFASLIEKYDGHAFCSDKSRTLLRALLGFYMKGELIKFNSDQEYTYHLPKKIFTTHEQIVEFYTSLNQLFYGSPDKYLSAMEGIRAAAENGAN